MTGVDQEHLAWLLAVDALNLVGGVGALVAIGLISSRMELLVRGGIALLAGLLIGGIVEAHLALVGVPVSLSELLVVDVLLVAAGAYRWRSNRGAPDERLPSRPYALIAPVALAIAAIELAHVAATAAVRPMLEWDSWAIWATKAHFLLALGAADSGVFANRTYEAIHLDYPILQPTIQALALRGGWDPGMAHLQLVVLVGAALWAIIGLCYCRIPLEVPSVGIAFLTFQPWFVNGLLSGYADVPVAVVSACVLIALLRFAVDGDRRMLAVAALFAGGAGLIKNEGTLFVLAAFAATAVVLVLGHRTRDLRPLGIALGSAIALWAPWRAYVALHNLPSTDYHLGSALKPAFLHDQFGRVEPATSAVWGQIEPSSILAPASLLIVGVIAALLVRRIALSAAVALWCLFSFAGLVIIYWISIVPLAWQISTSVDRVTTTLLVVAVTAGSFLAGESLRSHVIAPAAEPARASCPKLPFADVPASTQPSADRAPDRERADPRLLG